MYVIWFAAIAEQQRQNADDARQPGERGGPEAESRGGAAQDDHDRRLVRCPCAQVIIIIIIIVCMSLYCDCGRRK